MARKKHTMAPFEVVAGMNRAQGEEPRDGEDRPEPDKPPVIRQPVAATPSATPSPRPSPRTGTRMGDDQRPVDAFSDGGSKLELSVGYVTLLVAAGGAVVLLAAMFLLGRMTAPSAAPESSSDAAATPKRETGKYYLVIEATDNATIGDRKEAEHIAWFLEQKGIEASVLKYRYPGEDGRVTWVVLSQKGFAGPEDLQARQFTQKIRDLGTEYAREYGGKYRFVTRKYTDSVGPWFEVWNR